MENQFRQYPLEEDILGALDALGYTQPTEIQAAVIPSILNGRDIIAKSKTGSGKTAGTKRDQRTSDERDPPLQESWIQQFREQCVKRLY